MNIESCLNVDGEKVPGGDELDALGERIAESAALIDSALHSLLSYLRVFDEQKGWMRQGALSCSHWLQWRVGIDLGAAREKVRVARALGELPVIDEALRRGEVSYSKVRAMTRVATPQNERELLELARVTTAAQLERTCRLLRQQQAPAPEALEEARYLRVREADDGLLVLSAKLTADEADLVLRACQLSAQTGHARHGLLAMCERVLRGVEPAATEAVDGAEPEAQPEQGKPPVEVMVHLDAATLKGHTEQGHGISAEVARRLLCDAGVVPLLEDADGRPLDVGRRRRTIPARLRRALLARDGGCTFPSCTNRLVDAHHLVHWADGGETSLENLTLQCRAHHRLLHEEGFRVERDGAGALVYFDPEGRRVPTAGVREAQETAGLVVIEKRLQQEELEIDAMTAYPYWDGGRLDYAATLMGLGARPPGA